MAILDLTIYTVTIFVFTCVGIYLVRNGGQ